MTAYESALVVLGCMLAAIVFLVSRTQRNQFQEQRRINGQMIDVLNLVQTRIAGHHDSLVDQANGIIQRDGITSKLRSDVKTIIRQLKQQDLWDELLEEEAADPATDRQRIIELDPSPRGPA